MPKKIIQRKIYTDDEKERAVNLAKVIGPSKTSQLLGINPKSVRKWVLRDKEGRFTSMQTYADETKDRAVKLAAAVGVKKAAEYLNISMSNIYSWRKTLETADGAQETSSQNNTSALETNKTTEDLRATVDATRRELVVFNATADELKTEMRNLKTAVELLTETLLDTAQTAAGLVIPTITPGDVTC